MFIGVLEGTVQGVCSQVCWRVLYKVCVHRCVEGYCTRCVIIPVNGSGNFSTQPSLGDSTVIFQCNSRLFPDDVRIATCQDNGEWDSNLSQLICRVHCSQQPCTSSVYLTPVHWLEYVWVHLNEGKWQHLTSVCCNNHEHVHNYIHTFIIKAYSTSLSLNINNNVT